jgi:hypothetical protein
MRLLQYLVSHIQNSKYAARQPIIELVSGGKMESEGRRRLWEASLVFWCFLGDVVGIRLRAACDKPVSPD